MVDHPNYVDNVSSCEIKDLNGIRTHDLCDTGAESWPLCGFADFFNSFNRNNNGPGEAEDVQHGSDHRLDSDDNLR